MNAERLSRAVRQQLGLGRLLPLGDAVDGAWLAESAAVTSLRRAASQALPDVRMGSLRLALADQEEAAAPSVPAPPSALPPGPLRIDAEFEPALDAPLPTTAELLRTALLTAADRDLGLRVDAVDLRITGVLEGADGHDGRGADAASGEGGTATSGTTAHPPAPADEPRGTATAQAVISVPGVTRLAPVLGPAPAGLAADAVSVTDTADGEGGAAGRHLRIQLAVAGGFRALDVARAVRQAATRAAAWDAEQPDLPVTVAVLVSAIDPVRGQGR